MAAIAACCGKDDVSLSAAIRDAFAAWEIEIAAAARARGMSSKNADIFASAFVAAMEGAYVLSKAQMSTAPHVSVSRAMRAMAAALMPA
jgi:hypothetical protein